MTFFKWYEGKTISEQRLVLPKSCNWNKINRALRHIKMLLNDINIRVHQKPASLIGNWAYSVKNFQQVFTCNPAYFYFFRQRTCLRIAFGTHYRLSLLHFYVQGNDLYFYSLRRFNTNQWSRPIVWVPSKVPTSSSRYPSSRLWQWTAIRIKNKRPKKTIACSDFFFRPSSFTPWIASREASSCSAMLVGISLYSWL